ncbi:hypothetical protein ACLOJK_017027 [Asimina triloba]
MADHQRIHPVENGNRESIHAVVQVAEAATNSEPLPPSGSARSTKDEADNRLPSQPAAAAAAAAPAAEPASPSSEAPTRTNRQYRRYLRWCCWTFLILLILFLLLCTFFALLLLIFRPKPPKYTFDSLRITSFAINPATATISAGFDMQITIRNPNKHVGIYYERGSNVSAWYANASLCSGSVPKFYQGSKNTTVLHVVMKGEAQLGQVLVLALQEVQRARQIPLEVRARVPVKLKLGRLKLWKMRFSIRCNFQVDSLTSGSVISIQGTGHCYGLKKKLL